MKLIYLSFFIVFVFLSCASVSVSEEKTKTSEKSDRINSTSESEGNFSLDLETVDGERFSFNDIKGEKHLLAAFWATWCEPCKTELQKMAQMYHEFSDYIEFIAVSTDTEDLIDKVKEFSIENSLPFPVLIDPSGNTVSSIIPGGDTVPYSIIVHKNGNVIKKQSGYKPGDEIKLKKELLELLEK